MKDQTDKSTVDLFKTTRRRGRPVTGQAMTNAERQRLYRQNLKNRNVTKNASPNVSELKHWKNLYYQRDTDYQRDLSAVIEEKNRKLAGQKSLVTKYRNEIISLRDKIAFLERQLAQRNDK